jgi:uncharacterized protein with GYD domain
MSTYLFHGFQTPKTLAKLLAAPEDRAAVNAPLFRSLGGELLGYWYVLGGVEVYVLYELPDDVTATGMAARVASSGAFASPTCTRLMTVQETLAALGGAGAPRFTAHPDSPSNRPAPGLTAPEAACTPATSSSADRAATSPNGHLLSWSGWPDLNRRPLRPDRTPRPGRVTGRPPRNTASRD